MVFPFSIESDGYDDVDLFVVMSDCEDETGEEILISDGRLRASLRSTSEAPYDFLGLPWHPANKKDASYLTKSEIYKVLIDMMPISYMIKKRNRLKMAISNSMQGVYYLGHDKYEKDPDHDKSPSIRIYEAGRWASFIELPNMNAGKSVK